MYDQNQPRVPRGESDLPELHAQSALLLDLDQLLLSGNKRALVTDLGGAISWLHDVLDGAAVLMSGLTAAELDAAFSPQRLPMLASNGWERRWRGGFPLVVDPVPSGARELYEQLAAFVARDPSIRVRRTACGIEVDLSQVTTQKPELRDAVHRVVSSRIGFHMVPQGNRLQIVPVNVRKNHLVELLSDHHGFRGRQWVHIYDGDDAESASRMVNRRGGATLKIIDGALPEQSAHSWDEVVAWLCREAVAVEGLQRSDTRSLSSDIGE